MSNKGSSSSLGEGRKHRSGRTFLIPGQLKANEEDAGSSKNSTRPSFVADENNKPTKGGRRTCTLSIHSSTHRSPAIRKKEVDQQIQFGLMELEEQETQFEKQIRILEAKLSILEGKISRNKEDRNEIPKDEEDELRQNFQEKRSLQKSKQEIEGQLLISRIELEEKKKENIPRMEILRKTKDLEYDKIDEDNEQLETEENASPDGPPQELITSDQRIHSLLKDVEMSKLVEKDIEAQKSSKNEVVYKKSTSTDHVSSNMQYKELEIKEKSLLAKLETSKLKAEAALNKAKTEAEKAKEEAEKAAKKQQEELDGIAAAAVSEQIKIEDELKALKIRSDVPTNTSPTGTQAVTSGEERIIQLLTQAIRSPQTSSSQGDNNRFLARHSYGKDLPHFSGKADEWPVFKADFVRSTQDCGFSNSENLSRLRKCLKGDAASYVLSSMVSPDNVPQIMRDLEERFGQAEHVIRAMVEKARRLPTFQQDQLDALIAFGSAVRNLTATVKTLQRPEHLCNPQLQKELEDKLPPAMVMLWMRWIKNDANRKRDLENFSQWISEEVSLACQVRPPSVDMEVKPNATGILKSSEQKPKVKFMNDIPTAATLYAGDKTQYSREWKSKCIFCGKHSDSSTCIRALDMTLDEKLKLIVGGKHCSICFKSGHDARNCKTFVACAICRKRHFTFMCPDLPNQQRESSSHTEQKKTPAVHRTTTNVEISTTVILQTLMITVVGMYGRKRVRVLLDPGAQRSFILKELAEFLGIEIIGEEWTTHTVFMGTQTGIVKHNKYRVQLQGTKGRGAYYLTVRDQSKICGVIPTMPKGAWMNELGKYKVSPQDFDDNNEEVGILIGADQVETFMTGKRHRLSNGLTIKETVFGWTLLGETIGNFEGSIAMMSTSMSVTEANIQQLWDLDTIGIRDSSENKTKDEKEQLTKEHFMDTVTRSKDGRYSVNLPWIDGRPNIPTNRKVAESRLRSTTTKLNSLELYHEYDKLLNGWESEGIIEVVPEDEIGNPCHYIPHRAVLKPESLTTPIRPVFDASCKSNRVPSLNDCLEKGPNLLELIPSILLKFRKGKIGIIADIRKAFQMVEVVPEDREYLRFLWWKDPSQTTLKVYRHRRVVFGVNCSPFLLAAVLEHLLSHVRKEEEELANKVLKSLYVDNVVTSVDSIEEAINLKEWSTNLMDTAKLELRCWEGGFAEQSRISLLSSSGCGLDCGRPDFLLDTKTVTSVLGYKWDKVNDSLYLDLSYDRDPGKVSKRILLSYAHKVFDPIGFSGPATLQLKLLLRELWDQKLSWDEQVGPAVEKEFRKWINEMEFLQEIRIPRNMTGWNSTREDWQVHTFCDASKLGYAAVVFLRTDNGVDVSIQLMMSKSRVAPLKDISINRLELLSCFIGARLTDTVRKDLGFENVPVYYWSDSSTALAWIRRNDEWGTFVGNRVKTICSLTEAKQWRHVPGALNPADLPSRGCSPVQLLESSWWEGLRWLKQSENEWPLEHAVTSEEEVLVERKKTALKVTTLITLQAENPWYAKSSSFCKNVVRIGWVLRFGRKSRAWKKENRNLFTLSVFELEEAERTIMKMVQKESFPRDMSVIGNIQVKIEDDLYLVKSRLEYRVDTDRFRFPILLPHDHPVVDQLILEYHLNNHHAGAQFIMKIVREKYWIVKGRRAIRKIVNRCVVCRRFNAKQPYVVPAPLPEDRVKTAKVFEIIGVDLAGPLFIKRTLKEKKSGEDAEKMKAWIVLFTCSVYRCVHLELVRSLSTEAFMEAFSKFMARRGRPKTVYSDNGTNFTGLDNALRSLDWEWIEKKHVLKKIQWKFNPPAAPWWGGFWERLVRSVKELLRKSLGRASVTYQTLETCICEIEATINGRPLTVVTEDPDDLNPLTPAMFLHDTHYPCVTDRDLLTTGGYQKLFQNKQTYLEDLKKRFRKEYLALLVHRGKEQKIWKFKIGDLVFIGSDDKKRVNWPIAKIVEFFPGRDGNVRAARLKTDKGFLVRPIQWLIPMEISSPEETPKPPPIEEDRFQQASEVNADSENKYVQQQNQTRSGRKIKQPLRLSY